MYDFDTTLMNFQEKYNLFVDGHLNNDRTYFRANYPKKIDGSCSIYRKETSVGKFISILKKTDISFSDLNIQKNIRLNLPKDTEVNGVFQTDNGRNSIWYNNA